MCHVAILDKYLQKIPAEAINKDVFYLTPLQKVPIDQAKPWFKVVPVVKNRLNAMLKEMSTEAGLTLNYTKYTLNYRRTICYQFCATTIFTKWLVICGHLRLHHSSRSIWCFLSW